MGLCLSLPLILIACSGGFLPTPLPPPSPTATAPATRQPTAQIAVGPTATAAPTSAPGAPPTAQPALAPEAAPEIAQGLVAAPERDRYLQLMKALQTRDQAAADWVVDTGLFLKDARLDAAEQQAFNMLLGRKDDPLWYLTNVQALDGISDKDLSYLTSNGAVPGSNWFFDDDIRGLEAYQLLSPNGLRSLQRIFDKAHQDPEVRKGLYLINALGLPDPSGFKYQVPLYNVQLYLLSQLLEQGVPSEYERAAVAAALAYGSLLTVSDQQAREQVLNYANERVRLLIETDVLLAAGGAGWRSANDSLEALLVLVWGGQTTALPQAGELPAEAPSLMAAAAEHPLTKDDLTRLLVPLDDLRQMQAEMIRVAIEQTSDAATAADLIEQWWSSHQSDEPDTGGPDMGRQWARYRDGRRFTGGSEAGYVLQALASSINLPLPSAQLWYAQGGKLAMVPFGLRIDAGRNTLRLDGSAQGALAALPARTRALLVWWRPPWDNWHLQEGVRSVETMPLPLAAWRAGIPAGYLLRSGLGKEGDALAALGLAPSLAPAPTATVKSP